MCFFLGGGVIVKLAPPSYTDLFPPEHDGVKLPGSRHEKDLYQTVKRRVTILCNPGKNITSGIFPFALLPLYFVTVAAVVMFIVLVVIPVSMIVMGE